MNFLTKAFVTAIVKSWVKSLGKKQLQALADSPTRDFSTDIPLTGELFELWTRDTDAPPDIAPNCRRLLKVTVSGTTFYFYGRTRKD